MVSFQQYVSNMVSFQQTDQNKWPGMILCMGLANERQCYNVTLSLIGWTHTQDHPCSCDICNVILSCTITRSGSCFNIKENIFPGTNKNKTDMRPSYLCNGKSCTGNMVSPYWGGPLTVMHYSCSGDAKEIQFSQVSNISRTKPQYLKNSRTVMRLAVFAESLEAPDVNHVDNEDVVGAALTCDAPTTSE